MKPGFDRLKRAIDIGDVILDLEPSAELPRRGGWQAMRCPFHEDRVKSASLNQERGRFKCHACGVDGDAIDLVMAVEGKSFREAVDWCRKRI